MSALQQSLHSYQRAQIPNVALPLRYGEISQVERLDAQRTKMLKANAVKKKLALDLEKIKELESYYSMRRSSLSMNRGIRRKIDTSMVSILFPNENVVSHNNEKISSKNSKSLLKKKAKKRKVVANDAISKQNEAFKKQKAVKIKSTLSAIATILLVFAMLSTVLIRYAEISNQTYLNAQTEKRIQSLETEISKLDMDKALKEDLTSVQYAAASKGMTRPANEQVVFVAVNPELPDKYASEDSAAEDLNPAENLTEEAIGQSDINSSAQNATGPIEEINSFFSGIGNTLQGWFN